MTKPARDWERDWKLCEKATPGPWVVEETDEDHSIYIASALEEGPGYEVQHKIQYFHGLCPEDEEQLKF